VLCAPGVGVAEGLAAGTVGVGVAAGLAALRDPAPPAAIAMAPVAAITSAAATATTTGRVARGRLGPGFSGGVGVVSVSVIAFTSFHLFRRNPIYFEMKIFGIKILVKNLDMKI
jgi:hypothetical protein